jgi:farnesyl-diphosphate farnesyltransferase
MANLDDLLLKTSRTFALSIPLLPEPLRRQVSIAYLLFRIADTFEDAELWAPEERRKALAAFSEFLRPSGLAPAPARQSLLDPRPQFAFPRDLEDLHSRAPQHGRSASHAEALAREWTKRPPCKQQGYLELLRETPSVLRDFEALSEPARGLIARHVAHSADGMAGFVLRMSPEGNLVLRDVADLRAYCYAVAGIVGEMLTELFLSGAALAKIEGFLRERAPLFGEGLQLVNILKDSSSDLSEGRRYLPPGVERAEVFALARKDLQSAGDYVRALQQNGAPAGLIGFTALPVELAWASLDRIEKFGAGSKISRPEVYQIAKRVEQAIERNEPAVFSIS